MTTEIKSTISVDVKIRVVVNTNWGENTSIKHVHDEAKRQAECVIKKALCDKAKIVGQKTVNIFSEEVD